MQSHLRVSPANGEYTQLKVELRGPVRALTQIERAATAVLFGYAQRIGGGESASDAPLADRHLRPLFDRICAAEPLQLASAPGSQNCRFRELAEKTPLATLTLEKGKIYEFCELGKCDEPDPKARRNRNGGQRDLLH